MKHLMRMVVVATLFQIGATPSANAQFLDWIHKLSGIELARIGVGQVFELDSDRVRAISVAGFFELATGEGGSPAAAGLDIDYWGAQVAYETALIGSGLRSDVNVIGQFGFAFHSFCGDDIDGFTTGSLPIYFLLRVPFGGGHSFRAGTGFNVFWFPDDAAPVTTETAGFEAAWGLQAGVDLQLLPW